MFGPCAQAVQQACRHRRERPPSQRLGRDLAISPVALEAVRRIDMLFDIERGINGLAAFLLQGQLPQSTARIETTFLRLKVDILLA